MVNDSDKRKDDSDEERNTGDDNLVVDIEDEETRSTVGAFGGNN